MKTIRKSATVKVMLSHDYNNFEASIALENEEGITTKEIDEARKDCNRLCDKAILQYKTAKRVQERRTYLDIEKKRLEQEVERIVLEKKKKDWTPEEKAKVKALDDRDWELNWDYEDEPYF